MKNVLPWLGCLLAFVTTPALAQMRTVRGTITAAEDGQGLPGVSVVVKGQPAVGTVTGADGQFSINLPAAANTLVFSSIGMQTREVAVGNQTQLDLALVADVRQLSEVVVTAFGQEQEKKTLGYATQEVAGEELAETQRPNVVNALQGRVAGLNVGITSGLPGASSTIVLRGGTSIGANNQPLFVVDGIPVDNSTLNESFTLADSPNRNSDYNNRIADINPNDIESINVLKGPAAAALYGIDAANGAIVITTKKGKKGQTLVTYTNAFQVERLTRFPETQRTFDTGELRQVAGSTPPAFQSVTTRGTLSHWGAPIAPGTPVYDNVRGFLRDGFSQNHNLNISGGSDLFNFNVSASTFQQRGTVPGTGLSRNTFRLNLGSELSKKVSTTFSAQYTNSRTDRATAALKGGGSLYQFALTWPLTDDMSNYVQANGRPRKTLVDVTTGDADRFDNPNFTINRNKSSETTDRILLNTSLTYAPAEWVSFTGRLGADYYSTFGNTFFDPFSQQRFPNRSIAADVRGLMSENQITSRIVNSFLIANFKKRFGDLGAALTLGNNFETRSYRVDSRYGENFLVPNLPSISNTNRNSRDQATRGTERQLWGIFGELRLDYKDYLFLSLTGRTDQSSTLPTRNNRFFYPSASLAFSFSEAFRLTNRWFTFGKLRASFAQVGKDALPHQIFPSLQEFTRTGGGYNVGVFGANANIKPETTRSYEAGTELRFFGNRLSLDFTYYLVESRDQIVQPRLSYVTGYILQLTQSGVVRNEGVEVLLNVAPVSRPKFRWDVTANFALNRNKVTQMPADLPEFYLSDTWLAGNARGGYVENQSFLTITGFSQLRNANGDMLIGNDGFPVRDPNFTQIGNRQPRFTLGLINRFTFGPVSISALVDTRVGGDVFNGTDWSMTQLGLSKRTENRGTRTVFAGVRQSDGTPNTQEVTLDQNYYASALRGNVESLFIEKNINWLRLRDVTVTFTLPKSMLAGQNLIKTLQANLTGTNLLLLTNYSGADPDVNGLNASNRGSGAVGFDYYSPPATVGLAFGLRVGF